MPASTVRAGVAEPQTSLSFADGITVSRMLAAPVLLVTALGGASQAFLGVALYGLVSDAVDGVVARFLHNTSVRGARLDSRADLAFYSTLLAGLAVLFPDRLAAEWAMFAIVVIAYLAPIVVGWCKFGRLTSYHTALARISLVWLAIALFVWLWFNQVLPLHIGVCVLVASAFEELAITCKLQYPRDNVTHFLQLQTLNSSRTESCLPTPNKR